MTVWGDLLCTPFGSGALGIRCFGSVARVLFGWVAKWLTRTPIPCKWLVWPVGRLAGQLAGRHVNLIGWPSASAGCWRAPRGLQEIYERHAKLAGQANGQLARRLAGRAGLVRPPASRSV